MGIFVAAVVLVGGGLVAQATADEPRAKNKRGERATPGQDSKAAATPNAAAGEPKRLPDMNQTQKDTGGRPESPLGDMDGYDGGAFGTDGVDTGLGEGGGRGQSPWGNDTPGGIGTGGDVNFPGASGKGDGLHDDGLWDNFPGTDDLGGCLNGQFDSGQASWGTWRGRAKVASDQYLAAATTALVHDDPLDTADMWEAIEDECHAREWGKTTGLTATQMSNGTWEVKVKGGDGWVYNPKTKKAEATVFYVFEPEVVTKTPPKKPRGSSNDVGPDGMPGGTGAQDFVRRAAILRLLLAMEIKSGGRPGGNGGGGGDPHGPDGPYQGANRLNSNLIDTLADLSLKKQDALNSSGKIQRGWQVVDPPAPNGNAAAAQTMRARIAADRMSGRTADRIAPNDRAVQHRAPAPQASREIPGAVPVPRAHQPAGRDIARSVGHAMRGRKAADRMAHRTADRIAPHNGAAQHRAPAPQAPREIPRAVPARQAPQPAGRDIARSVGHAVHGAPAARQAHQRQARTAPAPQAPPQANNTVRAPDANHLAPPAAQAPARMTGRPVTTLRGPPAANTIRPR